MYDSIILTRIPTIKNMKFSVHYFLFLLVVINSTTIINLTVTIEISLKLRHNIVMASIPYGLLKFEPMIKKPVVVNHAFFFSINGINSFVYINSVIIQRL